MTSRTPPLPALRSFAALVRLGSVRCAAEELGLTQGAVSHQIRALEDFLEIQLVSRNGRSLVLTEEGRIYGYQIRQALDDIGNATERLRLDKRARGPQTLRISVLPSFANGWLLPRLSGFTKKHPTIRLALHGSMELVDLNVGTVDCAIRFGHGNWPDVVATPLMNDRMLLVASPTLIGIHTDLDIKAILKRPLLHASENWSAWMSSVDKTEMTMSRPPARMEFTDSSNMLESARLGYGIALTRRSIADAFLQRGELVRAHPHECPHASSYYLLSPRIAHANEALAHFFTWLLAECAGFSQQIQLPPLARKS